MELESNILHTNEGLIDGSCSILLHARPNCMSDISVLVINLRTSAIDITWIKEATRAVKSRRSTSRWNAPFELERTFLGINGSRDC